MSTAVERFVAALAVIVDARVIDFLAGLNDEEG